MGTGNPPFNSTGKPGINFAYIDACECGYLNDFIRFCYPYLNGYGKSFEDQCVMAYNAPVYLNEYESKAYALFDTLRNGFVAEAGRTALVDHDPPFHCGTPKRIMVESDFAIYGDRYTRVASVYTRSRVSPVGW